MQRYPEPNKRRYPLYQQFTKRCTPKQYIHPVITNVDEFSEDQRLILNQIKDVICNTIGSKTIGVFGSRIDGSWREDSDYDIVVFDIQDLSIAKLLQQLEFPTKVDVFVTKKSFDEYKNNVVIL